MSNIEIVRLNACFLEVFEVKWVKNNKCTIKDRKNPNVYVYEAYFIEKGVILKSTYFFERKIFESAEVFEKHGILC